MKMNKRKANDIHAKKRAMERFGVTLSDDYIEKIVRDIQGKRAKFVKRHSYNVTLWEVTLSDGSLAVAAYDRIQKNLRTIMKPHGSN